MMTRAVLMRPLAARATAEQLVVVLLFDRRAVILLDVGARIVQAHRHSHRFNRPREDLRIVDRLRPYQRVGVEATEGLRDMHLVADRPARRIEPDAIVRHRAHRLRLERVVVHPSAHRVTEESRFADFAADIDAALHELWQLPAVGPYHAPAVVVLVGHEDLVLVLENLRQPDVVVVVARHAERLASIARIVVLGRQHRIEAFERVMRFVQLRPYGVYGRAFSGLPLFGFNGMPCACVPPPAPSAGAHMPVRLRRGAGLRFAAVMRGLFQSGARQSPGAGFCRRLRQRQRRQRKNSNGDPAGRVIP